jgi:hypothetical protein
MLHLKESVWNECSIPPGYRKKIMIHKGVRVALSIPLLVVAAFDIAYGVVVLTGLLHPSLD